VSQLGLARWYRRGALVLAAVELAVLAGDAWLGKWDKAASALSLLCAWVVVAAVASNWIWSLTSPERRCQLCRQPFGRGRAAFSVAARRGQELIWMPVLCQDCREQLGEVDLVTLEVHL